MTFLGFSRVRMASRLPTPVSMIAVVVQRLVRLQLLYSIDPAHPCPAPAAAATGWLACPAAERVMAALRADSDAAIPSSGPDGEWAAEWMRLVEVARAMLADLRRCASSVEIMTTLRTLCVEDGRPK